MCSFALVPLASVEGQARLDVLSAPSNGPSTVRCGHRGVVDAWRVQKGGTCCGLASLAIVLSSQESGVTVDEDEVMGMVESDLSSVQEGKVRRSGMTLAELESLSSSMPTRVTEVSRMHGGGGNLDSVDSLRTVLVTALHEPATRVILNYQMSTLGQTPWGGHLSPVAAYHSDSDSVLICDTWPKTEPVWASVEKVWRAIVEIDRESGVSRGLLILRLVGTP